MQQYNLYKKSKNGKKIQQWSCEVIKNEDIVIIRRSSGQVGGKITTKDKQIKKGKNLGKVNETTPYEQAVSEALSLIKSKVEDNYIDDITKVDDPPKFLKPMLAKTFDMNKSTQFPCYIQPKLNGCRCVSYRHLNEGRLLSRECNEFTTLGHIQTELDKIFGNFSPDGEIYVHGMNFQEIIRRLKKYRKGETEELQYHVYDLAIPDMSFVDRQAILTSLVPFNHPIIKLVPTHIVNCTEDIKFAHDEFVKNGFEGIMIRSINGEYEFNARPNSLQKYKEFIDEEFEIIGHKVEVYNDPHTGENTNLVVWICNNNYGGTVDVRPKGTVAERKQLCKDAKRYYGKQLTVRYQELSEDNNPIFPVGITIRNYE